MFQSCLASAGARAVTEFGGFRADSQDETTRLANATTLSRALDEVGKQPGGGTVCLPPGSFFLTNRSGGDEAVVIGRSNVTLWGAGMRSADGGTRLVTRSAWTLRNGAVFRGNGIVLLGTPNPSAPLANIRLRDFELDGGAGYTGNFGWPANTATGDGWDISHKGIVLAWDTCVDRVTIERVWTRSYRGEIIYAGGQCLQRVTVDSVRSEDTNGSTLNITADFTVTNSFFGRSGIWMEVGAGGPYNRSTWRNNTFRDAARFGINIAQGDLRANTPHVFEGNRFENCGDAAFFLGGGAGGPISITGNTFVNCAGMATGQAPNPASWARYENQLVTFAGNTLTNASYLLSMGGNLRDSVFRDNVVTNTSASTGASTATVLCGSNYSNVLIAANRFERTRTPEQSCADIAGERPRYEGNVYIGGESRELQGTTRLTAAARRIRPLFEFAYVSTDQANVVAELEVANYPDGQLVTIQGGSAERPIRFLPGQASYTVAAERVLTGGTLRLRFSRASGRWVELP